MVRKKVRTAFLSEKTNKHFQKNSNRIGKAKGKNAILTFPTKSHGKEKGKNCILTFQKKKF